jgi:hypothetical protein
MKGLSALSCKMKSPCYFLPTTSDDKYQMCSCGKHVWSKAGQRTIRLTPRTKLITTDGDRIIWYNVIGHADDRQLEYWKYVYTILVVVLCGVMCTHFTLIKPESTQMNKRLEDYTAVVKQPMLALYHHSRGWWMRQQ